MKKFIVTVLFIGALFSCNSSKKTDTGAVSSEVAKYDGSWEALQKMPVQKKTARA